MSSKELGLSLKSTPLLTTDNWTTWKREMTDYLGVARLSLYLPGKTLANRPAANCTDPTPAEWEKTQARAIYAMRN